MRVFNIQKKSVNGLVELSASVEASRLPIDRVWYRFPEDMDADVHPTGTPFLSSLLLAAMRDGRKLRIEGPVDRMLLESLAQIMAIFHRWDSRYKIIDVEAAEIISLSTNKTAVGCFFSGGVDSFYTLLQHSGEGSSLAPCITHLLFVHGFDVDLDNEDLYQQALSTVLKVGQSLKKVVVPCSTNIHPATVQRVPWWFQHGPALASVVHCLPYLFQVVYIPASHTYTDSFPWGSHPLVDPLWSTTATRFIHDGCEATRVQKIFRQIARSQLALDHLRVCNRFLKKRANAYNCGKCEKCLRTKLSLWIAGVLDCCRTFDDQLNPVDLRNILIFNENSEVFVRENLDALHSSQADPQLEEALQHALDRWQRLKYGVRLIRWAKRTTLLHKPSAAVTSWALRTLQALGIRPW